MLPADVRFLHCHNLFVSQSSFTGESLPAEKYGTLYGLAENISSRKPPEPLEEATLGLMGTTVVSGSATAIVVTTGAQTFLGAVVNTLKNQRAVTSFDLGVKRVSGVLMRLMLVMVPIVLLLNGVLKGDWREALLFALAVAVGLTPEMLPLVVTASLAKGALTMAREQVIVKHGPAMQNLGAMDVLCTDKTGTLTQDQITLVRHLDARGNDCDEVL
jgi:P-type Mg2+ transporter